MNTRDLLIKFAKANGLGVKQVEEFLKGFTDPMTFNDLEKYPENLRTHHTYITEVTSPIRDFIDKSMWVERYQTVDLEQIIEAWYDSLTEFTDDDDIDTLELEDLTKEQKEGIQKLKEVREDIILTKFGSVKFDW